jgi:hypothetical protein
MTTETSGISTSIEDDTFSIDTSGIVGIGGMRGRVILVDGRVVVVGENPTEGIRRYSGLGDGNEYI